MKKFIKIKYLVLLVAISQAAQAGSLETDPLAREYKNAFELGRSVTINQLQSFSPLTCDANYINVKSDSIVEYWDYKMQPVSDFAVGMYYNVNEKPGLTFFNIDGLVKSEYLASDLKHFAVPRLSSKGRLVIEYSVLKNKEANDTRPISNITGAVIFAYDYCYKK